MGTTNMHRITAIFALLAVSAYALPDSNTLSTPDYFRATQSRPRDELMGETFSEMTARLNAHLTSVPGLRTKACKEFTTAEVQELVHMLMSSRHDELQQVYTQANDRRALAHH